MSDFTVHSTETAPADAAPMLAASQSAFGFIPNLHAVMAEAPQVLEAYKTLTDLFMKASLTPVERTVVWLTAIYENACHYCMPAHTAIAGMEGVDTAVTTAIREGRRLDDARLEALRAFTSAVVVRRGDLAADEVSAFVEAGFTKAQVLEVILGVTHKTLSNYVNHMADTPVDDAFKAFAWELPQPAPVE